MKKMISAAVVALVACGAQTVRADEVTLIAPGGMRCPMDRMKPDFEKKTGNTLKVTIGSGGGTHQQVVKGLAVDVPVVQPPYKDVIDSGTSSHPLKRRSRPSPSSSSSRRAPPGPTSRRRTPSRSFCSTRKRSRIPMAPAATEARRA